MRAHRPHLLQAVSRTADDAGAEGPQRLAAAVLAQAMLDALAGCPRAAAWLRELAPAGPRYWLRWLAPDDRVIRYHDELLVSLEIRRDPR